jgi:hypothetical protein
VQTRYFKRIMSALEDMSPYSKLGEEKTDRTRRTRRHCRSRSGLRRFPPNRHGHQLRIGWSSSVLQHEHDPGLRSGLGDFGGGGGGRCDRSRHSSDRPVRGLRGTSGTGYLSAQHHSPWYHDGRSGDAEKGPGRGWRTATGCSGCRRTHDFQLCEEDHQRLIPRSSRTSRRPRELRGPSLSQAQKRRFNFF